MNSFTVFDIETDGVENCTKIHCLSIIHVENGICTLYTTTNYDRMRELMNKFENYIGHYITFFDIPVLERILNFKFTKNYIDTWVLSMYLYDQRKSHGLEDWGQDVGFAKVPIDDWENLPIEDYIKRCEEDVKINILIFTKFINYLEDLYPNGYQSALKYLMFLIDNIRLQVQNKWKVDVPLLENNLADLLSKFVNAKEALENAMPPIKRYKTKSKPKIMYKKDGSLSHYGQIWVNHLKEQGLPLEHSEDIKIFDKLEPSNANSHGQVKDWLYSLGWKPDYFKFLKNSEGETNTVPQISKDGELTDSVKLLIEKSEEVNHLSNYYLIKSRKEVLQGFNKNIDERGFIKADIAGVTSTLRVKHRNVVNLPGVDKPYGEYIRGVLVAKEGNILCGSDLSSLEDRCKQHFIYDYDPEYVESMSDEFFDPHLDLAIRAGEISEEEVNFYKYIDSDKKFPTERVDPFLLNLEKEKQDKLFSNIKAMRKGYKVVNYSSTYGVGAKSLSRSIGKSVRKAKKMLDTFKERNWAIYEVAKDAQVDLFKGQKWVLNPVNNLYYPLRNEKDIFSALNQGLGAYIFNLWIYYQRFKFGINSYVGQFHDEIVLDIPNSEESKQKINDALLNSIECVNNRLKLNVPMGCDIQFGHRYSNIH